MSVATGERLSVILSNEKIFNNMVKIYIYLKMTV